MKSWTSFKHAILALTCGSVILTLGKIVLFPATASEPIPLKFPSSFSVSNWQFLDSQPLTDQNRDRPYLSGQKYRYQQQDTELTIEMRYFVATDGDVYEFLQSYSMLSPKTNLKPTLRQHPETGTYALFTHEARAYLSSCINAQGKATVTDRQFKEKQNFYAIHHRLLPWLLGKELKDERCLWLVASLAENNVSPGQAFQQLETIWSSHVTDWQSYLFQHH